MSINIGLDEKARVDVADIVSTLLSDTYVLYVKTQGFHWNVTGPHFHDLHALFEGQYEQLAEAADLLAERVRSLGFMAPSSFAQFLEVATLSEASEIPAAKDMVSKLLADHETICRNIHQSLPIIQDAKDESTFDMFIERLREHEKTAWMLRSILA